MLFQNDLMPYHEKNKGTVEIIVGIYV